MAEKFLELAFTHSVRKAQEHYYGKSQFVENAPERDALTEDEISFIQARDSFYMATVSEAGWPYVQHRGGQPRAAFEATSRNHARITCYPSAAISLGLRAA